MILTGDMEIENYLASLEIRDAINRHYPARSRILRIRNKTHESLMTAMAPLIPEKPQPARMPEL